VYPQSVKQSTPPQEKFGRGGSNLTKFKQKGADSCYVSPDSWHACHDWDCRSSCGHPVDSFEILPVPTIPISGWHRKIPPALAPASGVPTAIPIGFCRRALLWKTSKIGLNSAPAPFFLSWGLTLAWAGSILIDNGIGAKILFLSLFQLWIVYPQSEFESIVGQFQYPSQVSVLLLSQLLLQLR
jgi:hypothetical protein